jgi:hypothetical protein
LLIDLLRQINYAKVDEIYRYSSATSDFLIS